MARKKDDLLSWLSEAIRSAAVASTTFQTSGELPDVDPKIEIDGSIKLTFPLKPAAIKKLKTTSQIAPYGQGTRTLVDPAVRNTLELDASRFTLSDEWQRTIAELLPTIAHELGLGGEELDAHLYKLLIYEKGGFFLPHRDSEKLDRMVASLIVVLPNPFEGGELSIHHAGKSKSIKFYNYSFKRQPKYAAFYADCQHEVKPVRSGMRICLAYNLVLRRSPKPIDLPPTDNPLVDAIRRWSLTKPSEPLVFALEHHYTEKGLTQDLLKGADRQLAQHIFAAAKATNCVANFTQLERHESFSAYRENEGYGSRYDDYYDDEFDDFEDEFEDEELEDEEDSREVTPRGAKGSPKGSPKRPAKPQPKYLIEDEIEKEFSGTTWTDANGKKQPWDHLPLDLDAVVCREPLDQWVPTREEYEGYTGNAGNTLDRWYHRTALVVWPRSHHYEILASSGYFNALPLLDDLMKKLAKAPKAEAVELRNDCLALARGVLRTWPVRWAGRGGCREENIFNTFPSHLVTLNDLELTKEFLREVNLHDELTPLDKLIVGVCQQHGAAAFEQELSAFFRSRKPSKYAERTELVLRDAKWLLALTHDSLADTAREHPNVQLLAKLAVLATEEFCKHQDFDHWRYVRRNSTPLEYERVVPVLMQTLLLLYEIPAMTRILERIRSLPNYFRLETTHVPALKLLVPWCEKQLGHVPRLVADWLESVRDELTAATAARPQPPTDWRRPSAITCTCENCKKVKTFLDDPTAETVQLPAVEYQRSHLEQKITTHQLDLKSTLMKQGRPYSLILTKTNRTHLRAVEQYEIDMKLLAELPALPK